MNAAEPETFLELRTGATLQSIRVLNDLLEVALRALGVEEALRHDLALGVAELVANVCEHEYGEGGSGEVTLRLEGGPRELCLAVVSQGAPFDLAAALARAEANDPLEALQGSGLGLPMLVSLFDAVDHRYEQGVGNRITLRKVR